MRLTNQVYGVSNDLIDTYIERSKVDQAFKAGLKKNKHIMGYFLKNLVASQISKGISPPIFDYDNSTSSVKIIDSTFYFFIKNCDRDDVVDNLALPEGLEA